MRSAEKKTSVIFLLFLITSSLLEVLEASDQDCDSYFNTVHSTISLRHIEPKGLGYKHGYTTLAGQFFTPGLNCNTVWPFFDLRGHYFDNNEWAANAGLGIRIAPEASCTIFGVNGFVDYRGNNQHKIHYFQPGLGFEILGECWDFRINGYFSIHPRRTLQKCLFEYPGGFFIIQNKCQSARTGLSGELGRYICRTPCSQFYLGIGPYYYGGKVCEKKIGGRLRTFVTVKNLCTLQGIVYYDNSEGWIAQGLIGIQFALGCTPKCCLREQIISQPVYRNEIIVLDKFCKWKFNY